MMELDGILHILLNYLKHTTTLQQQYLCVEIMIIVVIHRPCCADFYK